MKLLPCLTCCQQAVCSSKSSSPPHCPELFSLVVGHISSLHPPLPLVASLTCRRSRWACLNDMQNPFLFLKKAPPQKQNLNWVRDTRIIDTIRFTRRDGDAPWLFFQLLPHMCHASPAPRHGLRHLSLKDIRRRPVPLCFAPRPYCELTLQLVTVWAATALSLCGINGRDWPPV